MLPNLRNLLSLTAGLAALAALACPITPASAGQYDVWSCRGPAGEPMGMGAWSPHYSETVIGDFWVDYDCASGGPFEMNMNIWDTGTRRPTFSMDFKLPQGASIASYRLFRAIETAPPDGPIYDYAGATREGAYPPYSDSGCKSSGVGGSFPCQNQGSIDPLSWDDPANEVNRTGLSLDGLSAWIGCVNDAGCNPAFSVSTTAIYALHQSRVTINDASNPVIGDVDGTITDGAPLWGRANLFVDAADTISGVKSFQLEIDGDLVQTLTNDSGDCSAPYQVSEPCPGTAARVFTIDTSTLGEGIHVATGSVTDASGNTTPFGPVSFSVKQPDTPGPPDPDPDNGIPAVTDPLVKLDAGNIWQKPGRSAVISGRLTTAAGIPVSGATLGAELTQLAVDQIAPVSMAGATTAADGTFSIPVPGSGARQVAVTFAPYLGGPATTLTVVTVRSTLALSLKRKPAKIRIGRKVRFSGKLAGAGPSGAGVPVEVQARVSGKWETVATVQSRSGGKWSWTYRFRYVKRNAAFSFRAIVRKVPGWPWPAVKSPVRKVRVKVGRR